MQILLVRLRLIGDVVFTTPAIRALRRHYPDARLTYLVEAQAAPVVRGNPHLDEVMVVRRSRGVTRIVDDWRLGRTLARRRFDLVIDFHGGPRGSWLTWLTGAPPAHRVHGRRTQLDVHAGASSVRANCGRGTRSRTSGTCWRRWASPPPTPDRRPARDGRGSGRAGQRGRAAGRGGRRGRTTPLVVMHVSAGNPFRRWPAASFAAVAAGAGGRRPRAGGRADVGAVRVGGGRSRRARGAHAGRSRRRPDGSCASASSTWSNCARSSAAPRSTSAATAARCTSRARRGRRSWGCSDRRWRSGRCRGAIRPCRRSASSQDRWPAARATSARACRATSGA